MRKRHLSECEPDGCDFMPLSKRINNLHINSNLSLEADSSRLAQHNPPCECRLQPSTSSSVVQCSLCNPNLYGISRRIPLPDLVHIPNEQERQQQHQQHQQQHQHQHFSDEPESHPMEYAPEMDDQSNPHYYGPNKLLFSLHIERVKRHGQLFKPNKYDG